MSKLEEITSESKGLGGWGQQQSKSSCHSKEEEVACIKHPSQADSFTFPDATPTMLTQTNGSQPLKGLGILQ